MERLTTHLHWDEDLAYTIVRAYFADTMFARLGTVLK